MTLGRRSATTPSATQAISRTASPAPGRCNRVASVESDWLLPPWVQATGELFASQSRTASNAPGTPYRNSGARLKPAATAIPITSARQCLR